MHKAHRGNKITSSLSVEAGVTRSEGRHYGVKNWGEYQAEGGYRPSARPRNPTPSDHAQEHKPVPKVGEVFKTVPMPKGGRANVHRQTRYGS